MIENNICFLNPAVTNFSVGKGGLLSLTYNGTTYKRVSVIRAFPFTAPDRFISVRDTDLNEIGMIQDLSAFDEETVKIINQQIELRYFTPKIQSIRSIKDRGGMATFDCETDKGHAVFSFRIGGDSVARLNETRLIFTDVDGNRFEIADLTKLTANEQKKLDLYI